MLRSCAFGAVALTISLFTHRAAGGTSPDLAGVLLAAALVTVMHRAVLARRERSAATIAAALTGTQAALHQVFQAWSGTTAGTAHAGMHLPGPERPTPWVMFAAHAVACAVLGMLLRMGESALWSQARRAVTRIRRPLDRRLAMLVASLVTGFEAASRRPASTEVVDDVDGRRSRWATAGRRRRGPPGPIAPTAV